MFFCEGAKQHPSNKMQQEQIMSIYIPYVLNEHSEQSIRNVFAFYEIGEIDHIDFYVNERWTLSNKKSAFVHMKCWYYSDYTNELYTVLDHDGKWRIEINEEEHWNLKRMRRSRAGAQMMRMIEQIEHLQKEQERLQEELEQLRSIVAGPLSVLDEDVDDSKYMTSHTRWFY